MVRFGIIGTNWITDQMIEAARYVDGFELAAVYSRTKDRAQEFANKYDIPQQFTNLQEMAESDLIDAVYIASPNSLHAEQAILFLNNKKHVLCEKPLAANTMEVKHMIDTAKANGVLLMEAMKSTLLPNFKAIQENLEKIGPIRKVVFHFCKYSSRYDKYKEGIVLNAFKPEFANGSLMDIGVYCIYPAVVLFGEPKGVEATAKMLESGVDGEGNVLLQYDDKNIVIMHSKITNSNLPSEIQGEKGSIIIDLIETPKEIEILYNNGTTEKLTVEQNYPAMYYEVNEFIQLIKQGKVESEINSHANSLITMQIADKARKSIGLVYPNDEKVNV